MKKPYSYREMSDRMCSKKNCTKLIKRSVVERFPHHKDLLCYKHHMKQKRAVQNAHTGKRKEKSKA